MGGVPYRNKRPWIEQQLDERGELDEFHALLADPMIAPSAIWRALKNRGFTVAEATVHRWAREDRVG